MKEFYLSKIEEASPELRAKFQKLISTTERFADKSARATRFRFELKARS